MQKNLLIVLAVLAVVFLGILLVLVIPERKSADERLSEGITNNDESLVKKALQEGANPDSEINGTTALVQSIRQLNSDNRDISIARDLVNAGADYKNPDVITSALKLCATGVYLSDLETDFIPSLISDGVDVNIKVDGVNDIFCYAVKHGLNYRIIYAASGAGADVNGDIDNLGYLPIEYLIRTGRHNGVSTLVYVGSKIPETIDGKTVKQYVLDRYGEDVAKAFYSSIFTV